MTARVVYHWWADKCDPRDHWKNLRSPIILSIATLRAKNPDIQIDVIDCTDPELTVIGTPPMIDGRLDYTDPLKERSQGGHDRKLDEIDQMKMTRWGEYPFKLRFNVWHHAPYLKKDYSDKPGYMHLSRIFDLRNAPPFQRDYGMNNWGWWQIPEDLTVIYSDADVFWLKDPLPLKYDGDRVAFNGHNTGYFYYKPASPVVWKFFEIFHAYTITALNNEGFRQELKTFVGYDDWYYVFDEMTLSYMFHEHTNLFNKMTRLEHCTLREVESTYAKKDIKMIHGNGAMMHNHLAKHQGEEKHCRGLFCLIWTEFWEAISSVLNDNDIAEIFTQNELAFYKPRQYPLMQNLKRVFVTKQEDKSYHVHKSLTSTLI